MALAQVLISANPWAQPMASELQALEPISLAALAAPCPPTRLRIFAAKRRAFHVALSSAGTASWNRWTETMLHLRPNVPGQANKAASLWHALAFVDLSDSRFVGDLDWAGRAFPSSLCLSHTRIGGDAYLTALRVPGHVKMDSVSFEQNCWIDQWLVEGSASFRSTSWAGRLEGRASRFMGAFTATDALFAKDCWFAGSAIGGATNFTDARFHSDAGFSNCSFACDAVFDAASFDDTVGMENCVFAGPLSFRRASFAKRLFLNRTSFAQEPIIDDAEFAMPPHLVDARFPVASGRPAPSPLRAASMRH